MHNIHPSDITVFHVAIATPPDPGVGENAAIIYPLPRIEILSVSFTLTTSIVAGNRYVAVRFSTAAAALIWHIGSTTAHVASVAHRYNFQRGLANFLAALNPTGITSLGFGTNLISPFDAQLDILVTGIDAADQLSAIVAVTAEWPDPYFATG